MRRSTARPCTPRSWRAATASASSRRAPRRSSGWSGPWKQVRDLDVVVLGRSVWRVADESDPLVRSLLGESPNLRFMPPDHRAERRSLIPCQAPIGSRAQETAAHNQDHVPRRIRERRSTTSTRGSSACLPSALSYSTRLRRPLRGSPAAGSRVEIPPRRAAHPVRRAPKGVGHRQRPGQADGVLEPEESTTLCRRRGAGSRSARGGREGAGRTGWAGKGGQRRCPRPSGEARCGSSARWASMAASWSARTNVPSRIGPLAGAGGGAGGGAEVWGRRGRVRGRGRGWLGGGGIQLRMWRAPVRHRRGSHPVGCESQQWSDAWASNNAMDLPVIRSQTRASGRQYIPTRPSGRPASPPQVPADLYVRQLEKGAACRVPSSVLSRKAEMAR